VKKPQKIDNSKTPLTFVQLKSTTMKLTLDIPNNQADFFLQLIRSLNFDITIEKKEADIDIPEWHKAILEERLELYETDKSGFVKWDDLKKDIEKQLSE
jgi:Putative addiction module component